MRSGLVFLKNPLTPATSIDLVQLRALARGFLPQGRQNSNGDDHDYEISTRSPAC